MAWKLLLLLLPIFPKLEIAPQADAQSASQPDDYCSAPPNGAQKCKIGPFEFKLTGAEYKIVRTPKPPPSQA